MSILVNLILNSEIHSYELDENKIEEVNVFKTLGKYTTYDPYEDIIYNDEAPNTNSHSDCLDGVAMYGTVKTNLMPFLANYLKNIYTKYKMIIVVADQFMDRGEILYSAKNPNKYKELDNTYYFALSDILSGIFNYYEDISKNSFGIITENISLAVYKHTSKENMQMLDRMVKRSTLDEIAYSCHFDEYYNPKEFPVNILAKILKSALSMGFNSNFRDLKLRLKDRNFTIKKEYLENKFEECKKELKDEFGKLNMKKEYCVTKHETFAKALGFSPKSFFEIIPLSLFFDYVITIALINSDKSATLKSKKKYQQNCIVYIPHFYDLGRNTQKYKKMMKDVFLPYYDFINTL